MAQGLIEFLTDPDDEHARQLRERYIFSIVPLDLNEWLLVCAAASPVWLIDEILKFIGRNFILARR